MIRPAYATQNPCQNQHSAPDGSHDPVKPAGKQGLFAKTRRYVFCMQHFRRTETCHKLTIAGR